MRDILSVLLVFYTCLSFNPVAAADFAPLTFTYQRALFCPGNAVVLAPVYAYPPPDTPQYQDVRINEILPDFNPAVGLPEAEFIELYNRSTKTFNLADWKYSDATTASATLPAFTLGPDSYVILCRIADTTAFIPYGPVLGLRSFPTLNDSGDEVELFDATGKLIDKTSYTTATYQDAAKASGGWSLELINPITTCGGTVNYKASINPAGGTPGTRNSVYDFTPDTTPPLLLQVQVIAPDQLKLVFSEPLDSVASLNPASFSISDNLAVSQVSFTGTGLHEILLQLSMNLQTRKLYTVQVQDIRDCPGNVISAATVTIALPEVAAIGDVVINEVLFNPRSGGVDFVELVNRSPKYISIQNWQLGNMQPDGATDTRLITAENLVLTPQQYLVLTTRPEVVLGHYPAAKRETFLQMSTLPAYPDDAGTVTIIDANSTVIDRFTYLEDMHFDLLADVNGVSLERISLTGDSSAGNWHSAASTVGYATPGYQNSQYADLEMASQEFTIEPKIFTPDNDGYKDFTTIRYEAQLSGTVANITIFDANGREIKRLVKNELLARNGFFQWDGLDERSRKVAVGHYILFIEIFSGTGKVKAYKETVVVGARFD